MTPEEAMTWLRDHDRCCPEKYAAVRDLIARLARERCPDDVRAAMRRLMQDQPGYIIDQDERTVRAWLDRTAPHETKGAPQ
jgi:hypothetical protein